MLQTKMIILISNLQMAVTYLNQIQMALISANGNLEIMIQPNKDNKRSGQF